MSAEDHPPFSQTDLEPAPLRLPSQVPPHAGDASCLVIASRSLTSSLRTPTRDRSRASSISIAETDNITTTSSNDLIVL